MDRQLRKELVLLQEMERALVADALAEPRVLSAADYQRLRYALNFARLTVFEPGAALGAKPGSRPDLVVDPALVHPIRRLLFQHLVPARQAPVASVRLAQAGRALRSVQRPLSSARAGLLVRHAGQLSAAELDAEVGNKQLVLVAGGGGGAGYVYIGAYRLMQQAGLIPSYLVGTSIGALVGALLARDPHADPAPIIEHAAALQRTQVFRRPRTQRRHGLPGLQALHLEAFDALLSNPDGSPMRISDLAIPYEAVVGGVRASVYERLPQMLQNPHDVLHGRRFSQQVAARMLMATGYFSPLLVKEVVLGGCEQTRDMLARDAMGFSASIPGVLHYEAPAADKQADALLGELRARHGLSALVDGAVANNVPVRTAWKGVQAGRLGTRNAYYLALDCFAPQLDPKHLWLWPVTQLMQLQMPANLPYTDTLVQFSPTLAVLNLLPGADDFERASTWGAQQMQPEIPLVQAMLKPVPWVAPESRARIAA